MNPAGGSQTAKRVEVHRCLLVQRRANAITRAFEIGGATLDDPQRHNIRLIAANPRTALQDKETRLIEFAKLFGIALTFSDSADRTVGFVAR